MLSRWIIGLRSALRALVPVVTALAMLVETGVIKDWKDLTDIRVIMAILLALTVKGASSAATARDVTVKGNAPQGLL